MGRGGEADFCTQYEPPAFGEWGMNCLMNCLPSTTLRVMFYRLLWTSHRQEIGNGSTMSYIGQDVMWVMNCLPTRQQSIILNLSQKAAVNVLFYAKCSIFSVNSSTKSSSLRG